MRKAIILAAGLGNRLRPFTDEAPKCLVQLIGKSLLERQLAVLESCGIDDVLDAMAAAWSARRLALGQAERLGEGTDEAGCSLSIVV